MVDAVVLAGSINKGPLRECSDVPYEALIKIGPYTMIEYVINTLRSSQSINRIVVAGPVEALQPILQDENIIYTTHGETAIATLVKGVNIIPDSKRVLVVTSDVPLLTAEGVDKYIAICPDPDVDFYYPIIARELVEKTYPEVKRTYATLKEGVFTGGNIFLLSSQAVMEKAVKAEEFVTLRKSPLKLSGLLGWKFIIKLLMKTLTIAEVEKKFSQILGIKAKAVYCPIAEIGFDVDKPSDLELAHKYLKVD